MPGADRQEDDQGVRFLAAPLILSLARGLQRFEVERAGGDAFPDVTVGEVGEGPTVRLGQLHGDDGLTVAHRREPPQVDKRSYQIAHMGPGGRSENPIVQHRAPLLASLSTMHN